MSEKFRIIAKLAKFLAVQDNGAICFEKVKTGAIMSKGK